LFAFLFLFLLSFFCLSLYSHSFPPSLFSNCLSFFLSFFHPHVIFRFTHSLFLILSSTTNFHFQDSFFPLDWLTGGSQNFPYFFEILFD
jgi:hypothetical protein